MVRPSGEPEKLESESAEDALLGSSDVLWNSAGIKRTDSSSESKKPTISELHSTSAASGGVHETASPSPGPQDRGAIKPVDRELPNLRIDATAPPPVPPVPLESGRGSSPAVSMDTTSRKAEHTPVLEQALPVIASIPPGGNPRSGQVPVDGGGPASQGTQVNHSRDSGVNVVRQTGTAGDPHASPGAEVHNRPNLNPAVFSSADVAKAQKVEHQDGVRLAGESELVGRHKQEQPAMPIGREPVNFKEKPLPPEVGAGASGLAQKLNRGGLVEGGSVLGGDIHGFGPGGGVRELGRHPGVAPSSSGQSELRPERNELGSVSGPSGVRSGVGEVKQTDGMLVEAISPRLPELTGHVAEPGLGGKDHVEKGLKSELVGPHDPPSAIMQFLDVRLVGRGPVSFVAVRNFDWSFGAKSQKELSGVRSPKDRTTQVDQEKSLEPETGKVAPRRASSASVASGQSTGGKIENAGSSAGRDNSDDKAGMGAALVGAGNRFVGEFVAVLKGFVPVPERKVVAGVDSNKTVPADCIGKKSEENAIGGVLRPMHSSDGKHPVKGPARPFVRLHVPDGTYGGALVESRAPIGRSLSETAKLIQAPTDAPQHGAMHQIHTQPERAVRKNPSADPLTPAPWVDDPARANSNIDLERRRKAVLEQEDTLASDEIDTLLASPPRKKITKAEEVARPFFKVRPYLVDAPSRADSGKLKGSQGGEPADFKRVRYVNKDIDELEQTWPMADEAGGTTPGNYLANNNYLYVVRPGDTVESLAVRLLGDPSLAALIFQKNRKYVLPEQTYGVHDLIPGATIELPTPIEIARFRMA